jgi:aminoglycoside 6'-N-acetyltransferase I
VEARDAEAWIRLRSELWPESPEDHAPEVEAWLRGPPETGACFVAESADGGIVGFAEAGLRASAEGCRTSPVGYLEGIYVIPELRVRGVGKSLAAAAEAWARRRGCSEMASDRALDDSASGAFHTAVGYTEVGHIVCYRKPLSDAVTGSGAARRTG